MAIARLPVVAIDRPDHGKAARFLGTLLDWPARIQADKAGPTFCVFTA